MRHPPVQLNAHDHSNTPHGKGSTFPLISRGELVVPEEAGEAREEAHEEAREAGATVATRAQRWIQNLECILVRRLAICHLAEIHSGRKNLGITCQGYSSTPETPESSRPLQKPK